MNRGIGRWGAALTLGGLALGGLLMAGCGGGGHSGDSQTTIHGELRSSDQSLPTDAYVQNGSYVDVYSCTAREDGTAQVDLKSSDFDAFLIVGTEDSVGNIRTVATDDNSGDGSNARVRFDIRGGDRYFVAATNSDGARRTGSYELDFSDNLKDVFEEANVTPAVRAAAAQARRDFQARQTAAPAKP